MQEYLSQDILEEGFIKNFTPYLSVQKILGTSRVDIRHRFVSPPTVCQKLFSILWLILIFFLYINSGDFLNRYVNTKVGMYYSNVIAMYFLFGSGCSIIYSRFLHGQDNVNLYIKLQKIDRLLKINQTDMISYIMFTGGLVVVVLTFIYLVIAIPILVVYDFPIIGTVYHQYCLLLELSHGFGFLLYFYLRLRFINSIIINYLEGNPTRRNPGKGMFATKARILYVVSLSHKFETCETDHFFKELLDGFANFRTLYQFQILISCIKFIPLSLVGSYNTISLTLQGSQMKISSSDRLYLLMAAISLNIFDLIAIVVLSISMGMISREILTTKRLCTKIMASNHEDALRKKAENTLKRIEQKPPVLSIYDMWAIKAITVFNAIRIISTLEVTLSQFMLL